MKIKYFSVAIAALLTAISTASADDNYPSRMIKIIQPTSAGGPSDVLIRIVADEMSKRLGQTVIVENRPGAGGVIGTTVVAKAPADGYTILSGANLLFTTAALRKTMPYDAVTDFTGVGMIASAPYVMVANKDVKANTVAEVVAMAKAAPDVMLYTSPNFGGVPFLIGQLLQSTAGIKLQHVTSSGSPAALVDVMAGRIPLMFDLWSSSKQHVEAGQLKLIASLTDKPLDDAPKYPTMKDTYPAFVINGYNTIVVRSGTPEPIIKKLNATINAIMELPAVKERAKGLGLLAITSTPQEYNSWAKEELARWKKVGEENKLSVE